MVTVCQGRVGTEHLDRVCALQFAVFLTTPYFLLWGMSAISHDISPFNFYNKPISFILYLPNPPRHWVCVTPA